MEENIKDVKEEELPEKEAPPSIDEEVEIIEDMIDETDEKIKKLEAEVEDLKNKFAMAHADTENTRKRLQAEADQMRKYRIQSFALEVLPVIDNLERALASNENKEDGFYKGVEMIYQQLVTALKNEGVQEHECLDKPFDPNFEQAIIQEKVEGKEAGIVTAVLQKGYTLKDRILRAAMVKVSE